MKRRYLSPRGFLHDQDPYATWARSKSRNNRYGNLLGPVSGSFRLVRGCLYEREIAAVDRCRVHERDDIEQLAAVVVHLPVGGVVLGEGRTGAVTDEAQ